MENKFDLIKQQVTSSEEAKVPRIVKDLPNTDMFIGEALSEDEKINELMTNSKPEITILVGFEGYGKTSFISTCYHIILTEGKVGEYMCYDSETLTGLERRLFLRRYHEALGDETPQTVRTLRGEAHLLTFRFNHSNNGEKLIVISDHSGEDYRKYSEVKGSLEEDILIQNADRLLLFVDVKELIGAGFLPMMERYTSLINNMKESGVFKPDLKVQVLYNKCDCINDKQEAFEKKSKSLMDKFSKLIGYEIVDTFNIVSNQIDNSDELRRLFLDVVESNVQKERGAMSNTELDWVKLYLKQH